MTRDQRNAFSAAALTLLAINTSSASLDSIGPNGINSAGLTLPDVDSTPLTGAEITIGQVEPERPAFVGTDTQANPNVLPAVVFLRDGDPVVPNQNLGNGHATRVAGVMISTDSTDDSDPSNNDAPRGVAIDAELWSSAITGAGYDQALLTTQHLTTLFTPTSLRRTRAVNHSYGGTLLEGRVTDGNSLLTLGLDWTARRHDVLHIVAGSEGAGGFPIPQDNYNGMTIAFSDKNLLDGVYDEVAKGLGGNNFDQDAVGPRTSIALVAPGGELETTNFEGFEDVFDGTSLAAPHVTGTIALLQQYADFRIAGTFGPWQTGDARKHQVMKAVLMNSADKIKDTGDGKYLGMSRTLVDQQGNNWLVSEAFNSQTIPLDNQMGAGHLNAARAVQQFAPGQFGSSNAFNRPKIGWDYGFSGDPGEINRYMMGEIGAGVFISVTLAWDRVVDFSVDLGTQNKYEVNDTFEAGGVTNLDLYLLPQGSTDISQAIWASKSTDSSVEHIFHEIETTGNYEFWVYQQGAVIVPDDAISPFGYHTPYGLAWWTATSLTKTADFNNDGMVDGADLAQWQGDYGPTDDGSDADGDGDSDGADFLKWQRNLGPAAVGAAGAVPEPGAWVLAALGLPLALGWGWGLAGGALPLRVAAKRNPRAYSFGASRLAGGGC